MVTLRGLREAIDLPRVEAAIAAAERRTSAEIRVSLAPMFWGDVQKAARRAFDRMGMARTRDRNGVLIFVVPSRRTLAVIGDVGIHERVGQPFWDDVTAALTARFHAGEFTDGLTAAIATVATALSEHFPWRGDDVNELPDAIDVAPR